VEEASGTKKTLIQGRRRPYPVVFAHGPQPINFTLCGAWSGTTRLEYRSTLFLSLSFLLTYQHQRFKGQARNRWAGPCLRTENVSGRASVRNRRLYGCLVKKAAVRDEPRSQMRGELGAWGRTVFVGVHVINLLFLDSKNMPVRCNGNEG
jgi:hypothetical protein